MSSMTSISSSLRDDNATVTLVTSSAGILPANNGIGTSGTIFVAVFASYVFLSIIYVIKNYVSKLIGSCFARGEGGGTLSSASNNTSMPNDGESRGTSFCCTSFIFASRLFIFNCTSSLRGDPMSASRRESLDESKYQSWSVSQVAQWAYSQLHNQQQRKGGYYSVSQTQAHGIHILCDTSEDEYYKRRAIDTAIAALKNQRIHGKSLEFLTLEHLLSFGLAFGVAVHLMTCLDELIPNHKRISYDEEVTDERFPAWYTSDQADTKKYEISVGDEELDMSERAQSIMKDRLGLSLPALRGQDAPIDENSDSQNDLQITADNGTSNDRNVHSNSLTNAAEKMIISMPPHVRVVAERRPDLVSKLLSEHEEPQSSMLQQYHRRTEVALPSVVEGEIPLESEEEFSIDQESICLLRRRTNNSKCNY